MNPGGRDFRLRFASPLVDRGNTAGLLAGESSTDLDGVPRLRDGDGDGIARRDVGAFEYQRIAPTASAGADRTSAAVAEPLVFSGSASDADPGEGASLSDQWSFDDGTSTSGPVASHAFAGAGPHSAILTVTDPAGLSASATVLVDVATVSGDLTDPRLSALRIAPNTFRLGRSLPGRTLRRGTGTTISFRSSEAGRATLSFERALPGRRSGRRCVRPNRGNRRARRCTRYVALRATVGLAARAGENRIRFSGRISPYTALAPGRYRLTVVVSDNAGNPSLPARAGFAVRAPLRRSR